MVFIEPIQCSNCGRKGRPGENGFGSLQKGQDMVIRCDCGNVIRIDSPRDQSILSENTFCRLEGASNYFERGDVHIESCSVTKIKFQRSFDFVCKAFVSPNSPIYVTEKWLNKDGMEILSAGYWESASNKERQIEIEVGWAVYGLVELEDLPTWYVHFYSAITHAINGLYKSALLDYAVAFEAFIESFLVEYLTLRYDKDIARYLLKTTWQVEKRCNNLLNLAIGHRLSECPDVYQPWNMKVRDLRNRLIHGEHISINKDAAENAHQATYQAIRWIQSLVGQKEII